jgi:hypothetical protein
MRRQSGSRPAYCARSRVVRIEFDRGPRGLRGRGGAHGPRGQRRRAGEMGFFARPVPRARVLAWTCEGEELEATTNADGKAWFAFESEHSCWNLTVAGELRGAVSVLGIRGEVGAPVVHGFSSVSFVPFDGEPRSIESSTVGAGPISLHGGSGSRGRRDVDLRAACDERRAVARISRRARPAR